MICPNKIMMAFMTDHDSGPKKKATMKLCNFVSIKMACYMEMIGVRGFTLISDPITRLLWDSTANNWYKRYMKQKNIDHEPQIKLQSNT